MKKKVVNVLIEKSHDNKKYMQVFNGPGDRNNPNDVENEQVKKRSNRKRNRKRREGWNQLL